MAYHMNRGGGINGKSDGIVYKNVLGAYTHLHALGTPEWAYAMVKKAHGIPKKQAGSRRRQVIILRTEARESVEPVCPFCERIVPRPAEKR